MFEIEVTRVVELAEMALTDNAFPNGALVIRNGEIVSESISLSEGKFDPTAHAEVSVLRAACEKLQKNDLSDCYLVTSLEPCLMCLHSAYWCGIRKIIFACRRSQIDNNCYEGSLTSIDASTYLFKSIEMVKELSKESELIELNRKWQHQISN